MQHRHFFPSILWLVLCLTSIPLRGASSEVDFSNDPTNFEDTTTVDSSKRLQANKVQAMKKYFYENIFIRAIASPSVSTDEEICIDFAKKYQNMIPKNPKNIVNDLYLIEMKQYTKQKLWLLVEGYLRKANSKMPIPIKEIVLEFTPPSAYSLIREILAECIQMVPSISETAKKNYEEANIIQVMDLGGCFVLSEALDTLLKIE